MEKQKFHVSKSIRYNTLPTMVGHAILFLLYKTQKRIGTFFVLKKPVKFRLVCTVDGFGSILSGLTTIFVRNR